MLTVDEKSSAFLDLMDDIEYRRVETSEDLEDVGRLRMRAYKATNLMVRTSPIIDDADFHDSAHIFAVYYRDQLISTMRLHYITGKSRAGTCYEIFSDVLDPLIEQGMTFVDSVRHATDPDMLGELPMPFITMRLAALASEYFQVTNSIAALKRGHHSFYRRTFNATQLADQRLFGDFCVPLALFAMPRTLIQHEVSRRYPFFRSLPRERELLFAPRDSFALPPLTVRPTARQAIAQLRLSNAAA
jgi:hypothetical protein